MASRARAWFCVTAVALAAASGPTTACFYDWDLPSSGGDSGGADAAKDATTVIDASDAQQEDSFHEELPPPMDAFGDGPQKGCIQKPCPPPGAYCSVPRDQCGGPGTCMQLVCDGGVTGYTYWCTCNGIYKTECDALLNGGGLLDKGCPLVPPSAYQCGYLYCDSKALCVWHPQPADTYECVYEPACQTGTTVNCNCAKDPCGAGTTGGGCSPVPGGAMWTCK